MSLDVSPALQQRAEAGAVTDAEFVECVRTSLPYAWEVVAQAAARLADASPDAAFGEHAEPPPSEQHRGQLLRALASDAIRTALERHFSIKLAFQNCHRVAAFRPAAVGGPIHTKFTSPIGQLRNQSPELRDC
jgi:hypothetical protein